jgi:dephospho-CoA kinase
MLKLKKIAVTGGLSAGKTTVCQLFKELGAYVVSADAIVHQLLSPGTALGQQVINLLGSEIVNANELDRNKIAAKVFSEPDYLKALEEILHPAVFHEIERRYQEASREKKYPLFVAEIPLLYEAEGESHFDFIISVDAQEELCKARFLHGQHTDFEKRMKRQISPKTKKSLAHHTLENNGTLEQLKQSVKILYTQLTQE